MRQNRKNLLARRRLGSKPSLPCQAERSAAGAASTAGRQPGLAPPASEPWHSPLTRLLPLAHRRPSSFLQRRRTMASKYQPVPPREKQRQFRFNASKAPSTPPPRQAAKTKAQTGRAPLEPTKPPAAAGAPRKPHAKASSAGVKTHGGHGGGKENRSSNFNPDKYKQSPCDRRSPALARSPLSPSRLPLRRPVALACPRRHSMEARRWKAGQCSKGDLCW